MNRKLKCILSAVLILVLIMSAVIVLPATAAENDVAEQTADTEIAAEAANDEGETYADSQLETVFGEEASRLTRDTAEEVTEEPLLAETGDAEPAEPATEAPTNPSGDTNVGAIRYINRVGKYNSTIVLEWNAVENATGYRVYSRDADKGGSFSQLTVVGSNSLIVRNLARGVKRQFKVVPYLVKDGTTYLGGSLITTASTRPNLVSKFRLASAASTKTVIKWNAVTNADGYLLYRQCDGKWSKYKWLGKNTLKFTDTNVTAGKAYYYRIYTFRKDSTGYVYSPTYVQLNTVCGLCAPADNGSSSRLKRINLNWKKNRYANAYELYYSYNNKDFKRLKTTKSTYYNSAQFKNNTKVYFRIYPIRYVGKSDTKVYGTYNTIAVKSSNKAYGRSVGSTYIEISISEQHMWFIYNGEVYVSTDVVTGNCNSMDTPKGYFSIRNKARGVSLVGANYVSYVNYWMAFIGSSYGIHDASWRSSFGGSIYKGNGSHGCVNTPYAQVKKIYEKASVGTPVIVY